MKKKVHVNLICISLLLVLSACAKKAEDYAYLVDSYKNICCNKLSSSTISLQEREGLMEKKIRLEQEFKEALKYLKQSDKEKLTKQWSEVIYDAANGNCKK